MNNKKIDEDGRLISSIDNSKFFNLLMENNSNDLKD